MKSGNRDKNGDDHWSDCAVNNGPALPVGECDCGGLKSLKPHDGSEHDRQTAAPKPKANPTTR
jgi:hypothetical protein